MADFPSADPNGPLEQRIAGLEAGMREIGADLREVKSDQRELKDILRRLEPVLTRISSDTLPKLMADVAELKGRVSQLPTTMTIFAYIGGLLALIIAVFAASMGFFRGLPR